MVRGKSVVGGVWEVNNPFTVNGRLFTIDNRKQITDNILKTANREQQTAVGFRPIRNARALRNGRADKVYAHVLATGAGA